MPLTLNQSLFLVLTLAAVITAVYLIRLFIQLRKTAAEGERALAAFRELAGSLQELDLLVKQRVEDAGATLEASKKAAAGLAEVSYFLTTKVLNPSSRVLPLALPVAKFVMRYMKKRKEKKNE
jgi:hypothetical protein